MQNTAMPPEKLVGRLSGSSPSGRVTPSELRQWVAMMEFSQDKKEFDGMLSQLNGAKSILEIGSRFGVSLWKMAASLKHPSRVVGVDLPNADDNVMESERCLLARCDDIRAMGHDCSVVIGDSHDPTVVEAVRKLGPFDFCFIDGDHSEAGVRADWENYGPMCKVIAFHDIVGQGGCSRLWAELKDKYPTVEYTDSGWMGIGILQRGGA